MSGNKRNTRPSTDSRTAQDAGNQGSSRSSRNPDDRRGRGRGRSQANLPDVDPTIIENASADHGMIGSRNVVPAQDDQRPPPRQGSIHDFVDLVSPVVESAERDRSPSAVSEASSVRLEWDASADVGSIEVTGHENEEWTRTHGYQYQPDTTYQAGHGLRSLDPIALHLSSGSSGTSNLDQQIEPRTPTTLSTASGSVAAAPTDPNWKDRRRAIPSSLVSPGQELMPPPHNIALGPTKSGKVAGSRKPPTEKSVAKVQSREEDRSRTHAHHRLHRGRSRSMIELATGGMRVSDQPILLQPSSTSRMQYPSFSKNQRATSSRDSVQTVLSSKRFEESKVEDDENLGRAHSTPSSSPVTAVSPHHSPVPSSNRASVSPLSTSNPSSDKLQQHHHDRQHRGGRETEESDFQRHGSSEDMEAGPKLDDDKENTQETQNQPVSEASTDWEYGPKESSSLSDWQNSGMTKSEVKYRKKKQATSRTVDHDKSGVYTLTVEVQSDTNLQSDAQDFIPPKKRSDRSAKKQHSRGIQTEFPVERTSSKKIMESGRKDSDIPPRITRSIQTYDQFQSLERISATVPENSKTDTRAAHATAAGGKTNKHRNRDSKNVTDLRHKNANNDREDEKSSRKPSKEKASSQRSGGQQKDKENRHPTKNPQDEENVQLLIQELLSSEEDVHKFEDDGSLSSGTSATCLKIEELLSKQPLSGELLELVMAHHRSHMNALKNEIARVRNMNKMVVRADRRDRDREREHEDYSSSSRELANNQVEQEGPPNLKKKYGKKQPEHNKAPDLSTPGVKGRPMRQSQEQIENKAPTTSTSQASSSSSAATYSISNGRKDQTSNKTSPENSYGALSKAPKSQQKPAATATGTQTHRQIHSAPNRFPSHKLDRLQRTCDIITDLLVLNDGLGLSQVSSDEQYIQRSRERVDEDRFARGSAGKRQGNQNGYQSVVKRISKSKQSFSFFVSFPNCQPCIGGRSITPITTECPQTTLQDAFQQNHPDALARVRARQEIIQRIKEEREIRGKLKREYIQSYAQRNGDLSHMPHFLPPKGPRVMTTREMRDLTNKRYQTLPEVQEKKLLAIVEREKETNRLIRHLYGKRVKQEALRGKVNLGLSKSIIRK